METKEWNVVDPKELGLWGELGKGSFGAVYEVEYKDNMYALKVIRKPNKNKEMKDDKRDRDRQTREALIQGTIDHPSSLKLFGYWEDKYYMYMMLELAKGGSLGDKIRSLKGRLSEQDSRRIFRSIAQCVQYLHAHQIAHRDIKPENILFDEKGHVKVADFGTRCILIPLSERLCLLFLMFCLFLLNQV